MYKVKLFSPDKMLLLQQAINEWLHGKKDILIHSSNLAASVGDTIGSGEYNFYVLYTGPDEQGEGLKEMAAAVTQEQSIEVKEINPEILKATS